MTWLPPGTYRARGVMYEIGLAKSGNERVHVLCEIVDDEPPHADQYGQQYQVAGVQISWFGTIGSEAASEITIKAMWLFTGEAWNGDLSAIAEDVIGHELVELVVEDDDYNQSNTPRSKVKFVNKPGAGGARLSGLDDEAKRALGARMRGLAMSYRPGGAASANKAKAPPARSSHSTPPRAPVPRTAAPAANSGDPTTATSTSDQGDGKAYVPTDDDIPF